MKNATPKPGRPGEVSQWPRWEGPEESRPAGYLPAERNAGTESGDSREKTRDDTPEASLRAERDALSLEGVYARENRLEVGGSKSGTLRDG
ncbi:hypothetical protein [Ciceribacter azotifigens]|uniref:hypothetical protein n=1 Tax=Ciceribacter azotifigens TaxID=2069303 RepID=UPI003A87E668